MKAADREARLDQAKAIGRIAYSHVRHTDIEGNIPIEGEDKHLREHKEDGIAIELFSPWRTYARPDEFSRLRIRAHGKKVFEIRWDKIGYLKIATFERGDWERTLRGWPAPIPFE